MFAINNVFYILVWVYQIYASSHVVADVQKSVFTLSKIKKQRGIEKSCKNVNEGFNF